MRDMDRWLGDGGMPLLQVLGACFDSYGASEQEVAFAEADWFPPTPPARPGDHLRVRGEVVRMARQVAYVEGRVTRPDGTLLSRSTSTFPLHREPTAAGAGRA